MLTKVTLGIILVIVGVKCKDSDSGYIHINGLLFRVERDYFTIDGGNIPVLRRGSITDIEEMGGLRLIKSNISTIEPGAFGNLPNLKHLAITDNKNLQRIEDGVINYLNLTTLDLSYNGLEYIAPHAFDNMTYLGSVGISGNKLKKWDSQWFANTLSMETFYLNDNLFTEIPANAFGKKNRTGNYYFITFERNPINHIEDDAFKSFPIVSHLHISINSADALEGNFLQATQFYKVKITINNVECLDEKYFAKIIVAEETTLTGRHLDENCTDKIAAWATAHQKILFI